MSVINQKRRSRARESRNAIEKIYITMRHLLIRGFYKPMGVSGATLRNALLELRPEIYGSIAEKKSELNGLIYVIERLPEGIEECRYINLTADEGYKNSEFTAIIPKKRRRNCYRIDKDEMVIEITRGRSEIYDILTHLTFLFIESHKIKDKVLLGKEGKSIREWESLENIVLHNKKLTEKQRDVLVVHLGNILGRSYQEIYETYNCFSSKENKNRFFHLIYWLGKLAINESLYDAKRSIKFSSILNEEIGHHIYGEVWAETIKKELHKQNLIDRPIHIISSNMHSVMNSIYAKAICQKEKNITGFELFELLSNAKNADLREKVKKHAIKNGLIYIKDESGTNIDVQIIDTSKIKFEETIFKAPQNEIPPVIIVMDYAFGEQAYETMDELLKPFKNENAKHFINVESISIMGKAGILEGSKGDIMIPNTHIFEGTADNYPFVNELKKEDFNNYEINVFEGPMATVLGTSLQNRNLLDFFNKSTWKVIGIEMEGAHYQKAIQSASKIRNAIKKDIKVRYAYYASDNPLETGATLASGGLGLSGVTPTYAITQKILEQIFNT